MGDTLIGLLHPGEMGAAVAGCLTARGHEVRWVSAGRGPATAARAVAAAAFTGVYVDANAISPGTAHQVRSVVETAGGRYLDGGIIGSPPAGPAGPDGSAGGTRLYLAGGSAARDGAGPAAQVAALFEGTALIPVILRNDNPAGASALKMAYAAWTKGSAALILSVRAMARAEGVEDSLLAEWVLSQPELEGRSRGAARSAAAKGWRWVGEMEEIAASMTADGLPGGFHQAAAEVFRRSSSGAAQAGGPDDALIGAVLAALLAGTA